MNISYINKKGRIIPLRDKFIKCIDDNVIITTNNIIFDKESKIIEINSLIHMTTRREFFSHYLCITYTDIMNGLTKLKMKQDRYLCDYLCGMFKNTKLNREGTELTI